MKKQLIILLLSSFALCPAYSMWQEEQVKLKSDSTATDSLEYDLIVTDLGFESYLITQPPMNFYSVDYYKQWNYRYVLEWNNRYRTGPNQELYENEIFYEYRTEYGLELEYKLYNYFQFFEQKHNIKLVPRGK